MPLKSSLMTLFGQVPAPPPTPPTPDPAGMASGLSYSPLHQMIRRKGIYAEALPPSIYNELVKDTLRKDIDADMLMGRFKR